MSQKGGSMQRTRRVRIGLGLLAALAALAGSGIASAQDSGCIRDTAPGERTLPADQCGGLEFTVSIPDACAAAPGSCGLIADFHGIALNQQVQERNTNLRRLGRESAQKFVVVTPSAATVGILNRFQAQDPDRIRAVLVEAIEKLGLDRNRVHVSGFSQGGGVAFEFICRFADLVTSAAAIAPAGVAMPALEPDCFASNRTALMLTQGSRDELVDPMQTQRTVDRILAAMGVARSDGVVIKQAMDITVTRFMGRTDQGPRELRLVEHGFIGAEVGAGHCFPGSFERPEDRVRGPGLAGMAADVKVACDDAGMIRIGEETIAFFTDNPRQP
jgi:poly(3-hydroxybutyrate) depolymerase